MLGTDSSIAFWQRVDVPAGGYRLVPYIVDDLDWPAAEFWPAFCECGATSVGEGDCIGDANDDLCSMPYGRELWPDIETAAAWMDSPGAQRVHLA